jgi:hypothetical protein
MNVQNAEVGIIGNADTKEVEIIALRNWLPDQKNTFENKKVNDIADLDLEFMKDRNSIKFNQTSTAFMVYYIIVPNDIAIAYQDRSMIPNHVTIANINAEVDINTLMSTINIQYVSGRILANSQAGGIDIYYGKKIAESSLASAGRQVNVWLPKDAKANIKLKVMTGKVESEFDLGKNVSKKDLEGKRDIRTINGKLNKGGEKIYILGHTIRLKKIKCKGKKRNAKKLFRNKKKKNAINVFNFPC